MAIKSTKDYFGIIIVRVVSPGSDIALCPRLSHNKQPLHYTTITLQYCGTKNVGESTVLLAELVHVTCILCCGNRILLCSARLVHALMVFEKT